MKREELLKKSKPILFNTEMVQAILDGRKKHTRRICKEISTDHTFKLMGTDTKTNRFEAVFEEPKENWFNENSPSHEYCTPQYKKDDVLYVRETWSDYPKNYIWYKADFPLHWDADQTEHGDEVHIEASDVKWKPSIHMPKKYARIFLKVTNVRVERLQDIEDNTDNFQAEGYPYSYQLKEAKRFYSNDIHGEVDYCDDCMEEWWINLWNATAPDGYKWEDNPYVFVYEFERVEP